jgi:hypothetical protein
MASPRPWAARAARRSARLCICREVRRRPNAGTLSWVGIVLVAILMLLVCGTGALAAVGKGAQPHAHAPRLAARKRRRSRPALKFTIGPGLVASPGVAVAIQPVGLSIEYPVMAAALGTGACPPPALAAELERLGSPPIELAGASQDLTAPSGALSGQQPSWETASLYSLPASFWSQLHCLLEAAKDPLTVGLNMRTGSPAWAQQIVSEAKAAAVGPVSFSLGNEPDLYGLPNYASLDKPLPQEEAAVASLYIELAGALNTVTAGAPLVGPELALPERWRGQFPRVLKALHYQTVGVHLYPLTACATPRAVTIGGLLGEHAADAPARYHWVVEDAQAEGLPAIISEANSASCGGVAGVSDSPAAAVWAVRFVLSALQTGFREVRFHLSGNSYDPFVVRGSEVLQRPLESALVALNTWLPVGSSVHPVPVPATRDVFANAIATSSGAVTLVLDNRGSHSRALALRATTSLQVQALESTRGGLGSVTLSPQAGLVRLALPAQSILAISPLA